MESCCGSSEVFYFLLLGRQPSVKRRAREKQASQFCVASAILFSFLIFIYKYNHEPWVCASAARSTSAVKQCSQSTPTSPVLFLWQHHRKTFYPSYSVRITVRQLSVPCIPQPLLLPPIEATTLLCTRPVLRSLHCLCRLALSDSQTDRQQTSVSQKQTRQHRSVCGSWSVPKSHRILRILPVSSLSFVDPVA